MNELVENHIPSTAITDVLMTSVAPSPHSYSQSQVWWHYDTSGYAGGGGRNLNDDERRLYSSIQKQSSLQPDKPSWWLLMISQVAGILCE